MEIRDALTALVARNVQNLEALTVGVPWNRDAIAALPDENIRDRLMAAYSTGYFVGDPRLDLDIAAIARKAGIKKKHVQALSCLERTDDLIVIDVASTVTALAKHYTSATDPYFEQAASFIDTETRAM